jgi:MerR family transcriptional regulator, light-induced transcriptional regulator
MSVSETYLKTRQVADALGVSVSTIQRWVDAGAIEATRTMGKHRRVLLSSALEFARRERFPVEGLLSLQGVSPVEDLPGPVGGPSQSGRPPVEDERAVADLEGPRVELLVDLLRQGRSREAAALIASVLGSGRGAAELADHLIRPVMERVGHGWMVGSWDVYQEHQASQVVIATLTNMVGRAAAQHPIADRPLAIGAAPEGDIYCLPGLLAELVLREVGWDVRNLGANLPLKSLAVATTDYRPRLAFLSASHLIDRARFLHDYSYFYEAAAKAGTAIILGGRALDPDLRSRLVYASFGERMSHLAEFGRRLLPTAGAQPVAR